MITWNLMIQSHKFRVISLANSINKHVYKIVKEHFGTHKKSLVGWCAVIIIWALLEGVKVESAKLSKLPLHLELLGFCAYTYTLRLLYNTYIIYLGVHNARRTCIKQRHITTSKKDKFCTSFCLWFSPLRSKCLSRFCSLV